MTTIVVAGALANRCRNGGGAWVRLSWVLGLKRLGYRTFFLEEIQKGTCVDAAGAPAAFEDSVNLAYFKEVTEAFALTGSAALIYEGGDRTYGLTNEQIHGPAEDAELLINISGHLTAEPIFSRFRRKVFLDIDPGYTQFWHAAGNGGAHLAGHDFYFTIGENVGSPDCPIPTGDLDWRRTRQPVMLEQWPFARPGNPGRFTTVASWRGPYGPVQYQRRTFGLKVHEWRKFISLPERSSQRFEIALEIDPGDEKDSQALRSHGWHIVDPRVTVPDPAAFRSYVQQSGAEFSVAQGVYVQTASGWVSDRTVRYLASGKPALVQDTGFSRNYPSGEGLVAFRTLDEAAAGAEEISRNYDRHCKAARKLAETFFDSDKVLGQLLHEVGVTP